MTQSRQELANSIDHTYLKPQGQEADIERLCHEARDHHFYSVCIQPFYLELAQRLLDNTSVKLCTVIGFPLGMNTSHLKHYEAMKAFESGADEIDMVLNIGALKDGRTQLVEQEIKDLANAAGERVLKVILETALLTQEEKILACKISQSAGANFVKTSTGFSTGGATLEDVRLMRQTVGPSMGVKASGGIRNWQIAQDMISAGANRLGTSASVAIVNQQQADKGSY